MRMFVISIAKIKDDAIGRYVVHIGDMRIA
jgi:hypothetical protein